MKEYIKKFDSLSAADGHVIDNPFVSTIVTPGDGVINLTCNEPDKKIEVNDDSIDIVDAGPELISFTVEESIFLIPGATIGDTTYQAEEGMTWGEWVESEYNTDGLFIDDNAMFNYVQRPTDTHECYLYEIQPESWGDEWFDLYTGRYKVITPNGRYYWGQAAGGSN